MLAAQPEVYGPGWWEGIVVGIDGDDLTLRWMDDADGGAVPRHRAAMSRCATPAPID